MKKETEIKGWVCQLAGIVYSPVFFTRKEAVDYSHRPKGTSIVPVKVSFAYQLP